MASDDRYRLRYDSLWRVIAKSTTKIRPNLPKLCCSPISLFGSSTP